MYRKFLVFPTSTVLAAVAVQIASSDSESNKQIPSAEWAHYKCKSTELPLYAPLHSYNKPQRKGHPINNSPLREAIESGVRIMRTEVQKGYNMLDKQKDTFVGYYHHAKDQSFAAVDYLNQPHNILPRTGAIAIGGLSGFIFAARGGFIKKVVYTSIGAGAVASLCYPRQAEQLAKDTLFEARKGYAIAYNFVKGVKPGDGVSAEPIKFPTSLEDIKFLIIDLYDEAKEALFPRKK